MTELEFSKQEVPEHEVLEATEVYLCEGALELSQGTLKALVSVDPRRLKLFWNPSGEKNTRNHKVWNSVERRKWRLGRIFFHKHMG